jgi:Mn2+/Fe2+ NRAMP family transporter
MSSIENRQSAIGNPSGLPPWGHDDLPEPLPFSTRNVFRTIGPGAILLAAAIGGGEWLVGPAAAVKHGMSVFWIATTAIVLQLLFNLEAIRYTLYTGEPALTGIMRLAPGSKFWATFYIVLTIVQLGVPALAKGCANPLFAMATGAMPADSDTNTLLWVTYGVMAVGVLLLSFGGTIERMLEWASWAMIAYIFIFLVAVNVWFVPLDHWLHTAAGFFHFGYLPTAGDRGDVDWALLTSLAATAGAGGIGNLSLSNWVRDKGFGMGGRVGAITSAVGGEHVQLSHVGKVFPITDQNLRRWRLWWKYVVIDQIWLWGVGCFLGMYLNVNLATALIEPGTNFADVEAGAIQAKQMADLLWPGLWILGLLNGFWILFSTHLGNTDILVRTVTDALWTSSEKARNWRGGNVSKVYYALLIAVTIWGVYVVRLGGVMELFKFLANVAGFILAVAAVHLLIVNTRLLPKELQPSWWRKLALAACALFYGAVTALVVWDQVQKHWLK